MIIHNIFHKIYIHPLFYFFLTVVLLTGQFKVFLLFMSLIMIHEWGHILPALYYGWNIEKIVILPFGGLTLFHEKINRPMKEEFIIALGGVLFQTFFYFLLCYFIKDSLISTLHYGLLLFNLLPIYPLDGSKIGNLLCNLFFSFQKSYLWTLLMSFLFLLFGFYFSFPNLIFLSTFFFLSIKVIKEFFHRFYYFEKFLLERYLYTFSFQKIKKIKRVQDMKRDTYHVFVENGKLRKEEEMLRKWFDKKG